MSSFPLLAPAPAQCELQLLAQADAHARLALRLVLVSAVCLVLAAASLAVDLPIARAFLGTHTPLWAEISDHLRQIVRPAESFGHGTGTVLILLVILAADVPRRRQWPRMLAVVLAAGLLASVLKAIFARTRPHYFFDAEANQFHYGILHSFQGWFPYREYAYPLQSLPSGHTTTAVAMAIVLSHRWPHATWVFVTIAAAAIMQRIFGGSHYLSDCFAGAALACLTAAVVYHPRLVGRWYLRFENRLPLWGSSSDAELVLPLRTAANPARRAA